MREIKFRLWNPVLKTFDNSPYNYIRCIDGRFFYGNADMEDYPVVISQFTGLKDKNGIDIYEGDVVVVKNEDDEIYYTDTNGNYHRNSDCGHGEIIFLDGSWYIDGEPSNSLHDLDFNGYHIEVIGNVYKNPELLKG